MYDDCPIEDMIIIETLAYEKSVECFAQVGIMRFVVKAKRQNIVWNKRRIPVEGPHTDLLY